MTGSVDQPADEREPPSPCIRQCTLDEQDECVGCGRTIDEILAWLAAPVARKVEISEAAARRREIRRQRRLRAARGGE